MGCLCAHCSELTQSVPFTRALRTEGRTKPGGQFSKDESLKFRLVLNSRNPRTCRSKTSDRNSDMTSARLDSFLILTRGFKFSDSPHTYRENESATSH